MVAPAAGGSAPPKPGRPSQEGFTHVQTMVHGQVKRAHALTTVRARAQHAHALTMVHA